MRECGFGGVVVLTGVVPEVTTGQGVERETVRVEGELARGLS